MLLLSEDKTVVTHRHSSAFTDPYRLLKRNIDPKATVVDQKAGGLKTVETKPSGSNLVTFATIWKNGDVRLVSSTSKLAPVTVSIIQVPFKRQVSSMQCHH